MKNNIGTVFVWVIGIEACVVMAGWIFQIDALTRISPEGINMKFPTALAFFFSAIGLHFIIRAVKDNDELSQVVLPGITLIILLMMAALLVASLANGQTGLETLFVREESTSTAAASGLPSLFTTLNFIFFGFLCMLVLFPGQSRYRGMKLLGYPILVIGAIAVIGYIVRVPMLYYQFTVSSVAMALNTALLFVLLGLGLITVKQPKPGHDTAQ